MADFEKKIIKELLMEGPMCWKIWANPGLFFLYFRPFHTTNQLKFKKA